MSLEDSVSFNLPPTKGEAMPPLNSDEIKNNHLLSETNEDNFGNASYDLSVGNMITVDGDTVSEYTIPPQGMIVAVSKEEFKMPDDIIGYTTIKNSLSSQGILALNIGLVDPTWQGPISSVLINFGRTAHKIKKGEKFLRMTFFKFNKPSKNSKDPFPVNSPEQYMLLKKIESKAYFEKTFLNLDSLKKEITKNVLFKTSQIIGGVIIIITILSFLFSAKDWLKITNVAAAFCSPSVITDVQNMKDKLQSLTVSDSIIQQKLCSIDSLQKIKVIHGQGKEQSFVK